MMPLPLDRIGRVISLIRKKNCSIKRLYITNRPPLRFSDLPASLVSIHSYYSRQNSVTAWDAWILGCLHASFAVCSKGVEKFQIQNPYSQEAQWGQSPFQFINNQLHSSVISYSDMNADKLKVPSEGIFSFLCHPQSSRNSQIWGACCSNGLHRPKN